MEGYVLFQQLETGGFEREYNVVRQVSFLTVTIIMAILYAIHVCAHPKVEPDTRETEEHKNDEDTFEFSLLEHQRSVMKWIVPLVIFSFVVNFLVFVVWKDFANHASRPVLSTLLYTTPFSVMILSVFINVELLLLIILSFYQVFNKTATKGAMKKVIKTLHIILWTLQLIPTALGLLFAITWNTYLLTAIMYLLSLEAGVELIGVNGFLLLFSVIYALRMLTGNHEELGKTVAVEVMLIVGMKLVFLFYSLWIHGTLIDMSFLADIIHFDDLFVPMSILMTYFLCYKPKIAETKNEALN